MTVLSYDGCLSLFAIPTDNFSGIDESEVNRMLIDL